MDPRIPRRSGPPLEGLPGSLPPTGAAPLPPAGLVIPDGNGRYIPLSEPVRQSAEAQANEMIGRCFQAVMAAVARCGQEEATKIGSPMMGVQLDRSTPNGLRLVFKNGAAYRVHVDATLEPEAPPEAAPETPEGTPEPPPDPAAP